jgi:peptide-methionine (S)-S-oxide reductase
MDKETPMNSYKPNEKIRETLPENYPVATLAGGCFWCVESEFRRLDGVLYTNVGYTGGTDTCPTYEKVCAGRTGHYEAVQVAFDPAVISYRDILHHFMTFAHDPTQANGQGPNLGSQYFSAIFYADEEQKRIAEDLIREYEAKKHFRDPIATKILPLGTYHLGEDYHQQYYEKFENKLGAKHVNIKIKERKLEKRAG